jgi:hypothetical protein
MSGVNGHKGPHVGHHFVASILHASANFVLEGENHVSLRYSRTTDDCHLCTKNQYNSIKTIGELGLDSGTGKFWFAPRRRLEPDRLRIRTENGPSPDNKSVRIRHLCFRRFVLRLCRIRGSIGRDYPKMDIISKLCHR